MLQVRILTPRSFQFRMQIDRCLTRLNCIALPTKPSLSVDSPDPQRSPVASDHRSAPAALLHNDIPASACSRFQ